MSTLAATSETLGLARWIPTLPFLAMLICGLLCCTRHDGLRKLSAWVTTGAVALGFVFSLLIFAAMGDAAAHGVTVPYFQWINIGGFSANFSFYLDTLTMIMLIVVTGVGTLITIYAAGYMDGDEGYPRFFAYFGLFIFAMTTLVMADNLLLLYLGWEGVGVASYLLIGYYYRKPSAAAAAKKAFIVNRVGDFGFALGIMAIFLVFGAVGYDAVLPAAQAALGQIEPGTLNDSARAAYESAGAWGVGSAEAMHTLVLAIPFLLMLGAFGKSAQLPLHVWLPDAMEGPTPVSALIHAATMVTAGVYMIARLIAVFQLNPAALTVVATVGAVTALFAATIALCQYDLKRIWAYSTISQLGYMFLGVGVLGTAGAVFHLFTHAFFKALLFLTAGSVMHAMAGQLDLRKMSGLWRKMPITAGLMGVGCLALAGFPYITAGFYSKDLILADALAVSPVLGWIGIITALLTAFYTFRLWFRVFPGETRFEMGREHHGYEVESGHEHELAHEPHEAPWWPMNAPLVVLAIGAILGGVAYPGLIETLNSASTAAVPESAKALLAGDDVAHYHHAHEAAHTLVSWVAGLGAVVMIGLAAYLHWLRRDIGDRIAGSFSAVVRVLHNKYYVDELYNTVIRGGLRWLAYVCYMIDRVLVDGFLIDTLFGHSPRWLGSAGRGMQRGALQGYGLAMALGLALILFIVLWRVMPS